MGHKTYASLPRTTIPTSGNDRNRPESSGKIVFFPAEKPRKLMGNGRSSPGRKIVELSRRLPAVPHQKE